jgi:hypothetical protein
MLLKMLVQVLLVLMIRLVQMDLKGHLVLMDQMVLTDLMGLVVDQHLTIHLHPKHINLGQQHIHLQDLL